MTLLPLPVLADDVASPQILLFELLSPLLVSVATAAGGGYAIMRAQREAAGKPPGRWFPTILAGFFMIFLSLAGRGASALFSAIFVLFALLRALQLWGWSIRAIVQRGGAPTWLAGASPIRLLGGGLLALVAGVSLVGAVGAFFDWSPAEHRAQRDLEEIVAWQLAHARVRAATEGGAPGPHYLPASPPTSPDGGTAALGEPRAGGLYMGLRLDTGAPGRGHRNYALRLTIAPDGRAFTAEVFPTSFPLRPYHLLVSLPTFRADESGRIRAARVRSAFERCPPEAPVVAEVEPHRIDAMEKKIREGEKAQ